MIDLKFLKTKKNLDSLFFQTSNSDFFYNKLKAQLNSYNKSFNLNRSLDLYNFNNKFNSLSFEGVNEALSIETKNYYIVVWKHKSEVMPVNLDEAIWQLNLRQLDAFMVFDKSKETFYWANHFFSKTNIYYSIEQGEISFTNDIEMISKDTEVTPEASELFTELGWLPPEMEVYKGVYSSDPHKLYSYSLNDKKIITTEQFKYAELSNEKFNKNPSSDQFYKIFKESIKKNVEGKCFVLTGGCDTRLILSSIEDKTDYLFWVDNTQERKDIYFDSCIFRHIAKDHNLKGFILDNKKEKSNSFEPINLSNDDWKEIAPFFNSHPKSVSGMFGGEILGGGYLKNITGSEVLLNKELSAPLVELLEKYPKILSPYFDGENTPYKQAYFMRLFFKTVKSEFYYPHKVWKNPSKHCRLFTQKPFLNKDILTYLASVDPGLLINHQFYRRVYKECAAKWMEYPFQNLDVSKYEGFNKPEDFYEFNKNNNFKPKVKEKDSSLRRSNLLKENL